jgi:hypothetical protein
MLQETIVTIEAIEIRRLEKAVVLQILNRSL